MQAVPHSQDTGVAKSRACHNCSRAKTKCTVQTEDMSAQQCARCFRLKKDCVVQPRAKRKKRGPNATVTAGLEAKIESLVNLLSTTQSPRAGHAENNPVTNNLQMNPLPTFPFDKPINCLNEGAPLLACSSQVATVPNRTRATTPSATNSKTESLLSSDTPPIKSPDDLLQVFKAQFAIQFPYDVLSPHMTAVDLEVQQPRLYKMIMMVVSSHEPLQQIETGKLLLSEISTALLLRGEKTLDMLQALLVYLSWSHFYAAVPLHMQSSGILQLILALVYDLSLNRAVRFDVETDKILADAVKRKGVAHAPREAERSLAERRALLYAFYLSSTFSTCIRKADGLQPSPYIEYNCKMLQEVADCDADLILAACVRFQLIADTVHRALPNRLSNSDGRNAPLWMHNTHLQNELSSILNGLPADLQNHTFMRISYLNVDVFLLDAAILETTKIQAYNPRRIDLRWSCLLGSKSLLDTFLTVPVSAYHTIPFTVMCQVSSSLMNLFKLAFLEDLGWDLIHVRNTIKLEYYFDNLTSRMEQAGSGIDRFMPTKDSFPTKCAMSFNWAKTWYHAKVGSGPDEGQSDANHPTDRIESSDDMLNYNGFDSIDDINWQELMMDFNYEPVQ